MAEKGRGQSFADMSAKKFFEIFDALPNKVKGKPCLSLITTRIIGDRCRLWDETHKNLLFLVVDIQDVGGSPEPLRNKTFFL